MWDNNKYTEQYMQNDKYIEQWTQENSSVVQESFCTVDWKPLFSVAAEILIK